MIDVLLMLLVMPAVVLALAVDVAAVVAWIWRRWR